MPPPNMNAAPIPPIVLLYGLLGLIPFLAPPLIGVMFPELRPTVGVILSLYAGLILSFLGGARWGFAVQAPAPSACTVSLAMLPTLVALGLLALPGDLNRQRWAGLAVALGLHCVWDLSTATPPAWYGKLRTILTAGAIAGLAGGILLLA